MWAITAFVCRCVPPKCSSSSYLDPAPTGWVQRFLSQRGKWGRPSFPRGNEVATRSGWAMRSPPSQRGKWGRPSFLIKNVLSVNAYIAQCFAIVLLQCITHRVICRAVRAKLSTDWVKSSRFSEEMRSSLVPGCISLPKLLCHVSVTVLEW